MNFQPRTFRSLRIALLADRDSPPVWQVELAARLRAAGHDVGIVFAPPVVSKPVALLQGIEQRLYRLGPGRASSVADAQAMSAFPELQGDPDLVIDPSGCGAVPAENRMTLACDGAAGEAAAYASLLQGRPPVLTVDLLTRDGMRRRIGQATPGLEEPHIFSRSFDRVCERVSDLLFSCIRDFAAGLASGEAVAASAPAPQIGMASALAFAAGSFADRMGRRLLRPLAVDEHWRLGWRMVSGDGIAETLSLPVGPYRFLDDDWKRFFADPFVLWRDGVAHVLCEEFPYKTRKGVISHFTIDPQGRASKPRVVLERPCHLSYPFLFERDGAIFMIPETSANGTVELYRADPFPDVWKLERILIEGVKFGDATLLERDGLFWLFGTITDGRRSTWDALGIFFAEKLEGPWRAHPANPVLIDAGSARPAGAFFENGGVLYRPAQDCRDGYGAKLAICRVDLLDTERYAQTIVHRFDPPAGWGGKAFHTLNRSGPVEVVDTKGWLRKV